MSPSGNSAIFTAADRESGATVKVTMSDGSFVSVTYNVVEPSGVIIEQEVGTHVFHIHGLPSVGFKGRAYITPADVSFHNIEVQEGAVNAVAIEYLAYQNGLPHA